MKLIVTYVLGFCLLLAAYQSMFIVDEGRQAIITQFGRPIGLAISDAGLHFKLPFVQDARYVEKRILTWDGHPNQIPTKDKKYIIVDTTARWRIVNPLLFIQTVQNEARARGRLDDILDAVTRDTISNHNLVEAVRNSNSILELIDQRKEEAKINPVETEEEEITGDIATIKVGREKLSSMIIERASEELSKLGMELIDVQLRRIAYEKSVEKKVYERMISERRRIAEKIRSVGKGEQAKIQGKTSKDLQKIQSSAYRKAQEIKGAAEAKAIKIYAQALKKDPQFYDFLRKMEAYKAALKEDTEFILSTDSKFLDLLKR